MADLEEVGWKQSSNLREYVREMGRTFDTLRWVWTHLMDADAKNAARWMFAFKVMKIMIALVTIAFLNPLVSALADESAHAYVIVGSIFATLSVQALCGLRERISWERMWGAIRGNMDMVLSRLFFDKGVAQYRDSKSFLSPSNMHTARSRVWSVTEMLAFHGLDVLINIVVTFIVTWLYSPMAGGVAFVMITTSMFIVAKLNQRMSTKIGELEEGFRREDRYRDDVWELAERVVQSGKAQDEIRSIGSRMRGLLVKDFKVWVSYSYKATGRTLINNALLAVALLVVSWQVLHQLIPADVIVPVFVWLLGLVGQMGMIAHIERHLAWSLPAARAMIDTLEQPTTVPRAESPVEVNPSGPLAIDFKNVSFQYPGASAPVLRGINLSINAGDSVALVGMSGAGKSTLGDLMMRAMDPDDGSLMVRGVNGREHDLRELDLDGYYSITGHIPQDPKVFNRTVRENALYQVLDADRGEYSDERVLEVLKMVGLDDTHRFEKGLDTPIGKRGTQLSGGERQRLLIASVLLLSLRFVVIDEATSALDAKTELKVQDAIDKMIGSGTTSVVIAHRLCTLRKCNRVVVLRPLTELADGESQIEYDGTFEGAMKHSPTFREFAQLQQQLLTGSVN